MLFLKTVSKAPLMTKYHYFILQNSQSNASIVNSGEFVLPRMKGNPDYYPAGILCPGGKF